MVDEYPDVVFDWRGRSLRCAVEPGGLLTLDIGSFNRGRLEAIINVRPEWDLSERIPTFIGRFDLLGARTATNVAKEASRRFSGTAVDWESALLLATEEALRFVLSPEPAVVLADVKATNAPRWLIPGFVDATGPTSIVGPGGTSKSQLALATAAAVATGSPKILGVRPNLTGTVLYLDWEDDHRTHAERLNALCATAGVAVPRNIIYQRMSAPLAASGDLVQRLVDEYDPVLIVVDSVMLARGADAFGPEGTINLYQAIRGFEVCSLLVDHKSKAAMKEGARGAYGSIVNENAARLVWELQKTTMPDGLFGVRLDKIKANHVGRMRSLAWKVEMVSDASGRLVTVGFEVTEPASITDSNVRQSVEAQVHSLLSRSGETGLLVAELSNVIGVSDTQVRNALKKLKDKRKAKGDGQTPQRWWLADHAPDSLDLDQ